MEEEFEEEGASPRPEEGSGASEEEEDEVEGEEEKHMFLPSLSHRRLRVALNAPPARPTERAMRAVCSQWMPMMMMMR